MGYPSILGTRVTCILAVIVPQKYASPYLCYSAKFGHSRLNYTSVIKEICYQILPPPLMNSLSLSLKVIGIHEYRSATIRLGNNGPISYREKSDTCKGDRIFNKHTPGFSLDFCIGAGAQNSTRISKSLPDR